MSDQERVERGEIRGIRAVLVLVERDHDRDIARRQAERWLAALEEIAEELAELPEPARRNTPHEKWLAVLSGSIERYLESAQDAATGHRIVCHACGVTAVAPNAEWQRTPPRCPECGGEQEREPLVDDSDPANPGGV